MIDIEFIRMCELFEPMQDEWNPICGDLFAYTSEHDFSDNFGYYLGNIKYDIKEEDRHFIRDVSGIYMDKNFNPRKHIWIPSQSILQRMLEDCIDIRFWDLCKESKGWLTFGRDISEKRIYPPDSLNGIKLCHYSDMATKALLKMIVYDRYYFIWDGENWVEYVDSSLN